jgi:hypothetical protein
VNLPLGLPGDGPIHRFEKLEAYGWLCLPPGWISGLILSNDGTDATNDIAVSKGVCRSTVNVAVLVSCGPRWRSLRRVGGTRLI